jgi:pilus assembly protein Flp/PilA
VPLRLLRDDRGASLVEYLVLVGCVAVLVLAGFRAFGTSVRDKASAQAACVSSLDCAAGTAKYELMSADASAAIVADSTEVVVASVEGTPASTTTSTPTATPTSGPGGDVGSSATAAAIAAAAGAAQGPGAHGSDIAGGFFVDGLYGDLHGLYALATDPVGTAQALWTLGGMVHQGLPFVPVVMTPNPLYDPQQARALQQLGWDLGAAAADYVWNEPDRAVGRAGYEVATFYVAPAKILKLLEVGKGKWLTRIPRFGKAAEVLGPIAEAWKATRIPIDPVAMQQLERYGLGPDSEVYRVVDPQYLDTGAQRIAGNPKSMARVQNPYDMVENPNYRAMVEEGFDPGPQMPRQIPNRLEARDLGKPGLNVAVDDPGVYRQPGMLKIAVRVEDIMRAGGRIYPDWGSGADIRPIYVTFDGTLPYRVVP